MGKWGTTLHHLWRHSLRRTVLTAAVVTVGIAWLASWVGYRADFRDQQILLEEIATMEAHFLEMLDHEADGGLCACGEQFTITTLEKTIKRHADYGAFSNSDELVIGRRNGNMIEFLVAQQKNTHGNIEPVEIGSGLAEPMELALSGKSGSIVGRDYLGTIVVAGYHPVGETNLGVVMKRNLSQIREPFVVGALTASGAGVLIVFLGAFLYSLATGGLRKRVAEGEAKFEAFVTNLAEGLEIADLNEVITYANPAAERIRGVEPDSLVGRSLFEFCDEKAVEQLKYQTGIRSQGQASIYEYEIIRQDGELRTLHVRATPRHDYDGNVCGSYGVISDITESKKAESTLQKSEESLNEAQEIANLGSWSWNLDSNEIQWSDEMYRILGLEPGTAPDLETVRQGIVPEDLPNFDKAVSISEQGREFEAIEYRYCRPDGEVRYFIGRSRASYGTSGKITRIHGTLQDITERKKAEEEVSEQKAFLQRIIDTDPNFLFVKDRESRFVLVNKAVADAYGSTVDGLIGKSDADFNPNQEEVDHFHRDDLDVIDNQVDKFIPEEKVTTSTGDICWLQTIKVPLEDSSGKVSYLLGASTDITQRKLAEESLKLQDQYISATIESTADGILVEDENRKLIFANSSFAKMWAIPEADIGNAHDHQILERILDQVKEPGLFGQRVEQLHLSAETAIDIIELNDGRVIERYSGPLTKRTGRTGRVWSYHDITDRVFAERELQKSRDQLRALAVELTLSEEGERRRLASQLHDSIGHSLVLAKMKLDQIRDPEAIELAETKEILAGAIESTRSLTFEISPPILHELGLVDALKWLADSMAEREGVTVAYRCSDYILSISEILKITLYQAVRELLQNVTKHARASNIEVVIDHGDSFITIEVRDDGIGFDVAVLQSKGSSQVGYGLFSIKERLQFLGGTLDVRSTPGKGTRVILDVEKTDTDGKQREIRVTPSVSEKVNLLSDPSVPIRVLLADDQTLMREGLTHLLEKHDYIEVVGDAANGQEAVELTRQLKPDVVVMDVDMPVMNGIEATEIITRELEGTAVIALSMYSSERYVGRMLKAGAQGYLLKDAAGVELVSALTATSSNLIFLSAKIRDVLVKDFIEKTIASLDATLSVLTAREKEVLQLVANGESSKGIAIDLGISVKTVQNHRQNISRKLGIHTHAGLIKFAIREGLT